MASTVALTALPSLFAACIALLIGSLLAQRVSLLRRFSIPAPIVGGLMVAMTMLLLKLTADVGFTLETSTKSTLLLIFFASIGLTADLSLLRRGGPRLGRFLLALFPFLVVQNALGIPLAKLLGLHAVLGLIAGSVTLIGGHGTGSAYAERFAADYGILGVMGLTMTSATIGLVIGGVIGGPVAGSVIERLKGGVPVVPTASGGVVGGPANTPVTTHTLTIALSAALASVLPGEAIAGLLDGSAITIPSFLWCLLVGLVLRKVSPPLDCACPTLRLNLRALSACPCSWSGR